MPIAIYSSTKKVLNIHNFLWRCISVEGSLDPAVHKYLSMKHVEVIVNTLKLSICPNILLINFKLPQLISYDRLF